VGYKITNTGHFRRPVVSSGEKIQIPGKKPDGNSPGTIKIQLMTHNCQRGKVESICNCIAKVQPALGKGSVQWMKKGRQTRHQRLNVFTNMHRVLWDLIK